jgi:hypothetical protein
MITIAAILGVLILCAIAVVFWFMKGSKEELKEAGVHLDKELPWPFPIAMPQHDHAKKKQAAKKKPISPATQAIWDKNFKAKDVAKALDKQAPKSKEKAMATKPGLYANIHAKQKRIEKQKAEGKPVETMRKPGTKGAPTAKAFKESAKTAKK